jgi:hypothetical protein
VTDNGLNIANAIRAGNATAASDGSYKLSRGTSAFTLMGTDLAKRIVGVNAVPGSKSDQSAYQSELAGISGVASVVNAICKLHNVTSGMIEMGLDDNSALNQAAGDWPLNPNQPDFDMLHDIRAKIATSPITVPGTGTGLPRDKHVPFHCLDYWARTNVEMDALAKAF